MKRNKLNLFIFLFIFIALASNVLAQPPFEDVQVESATRGIVIEYPKYMYIEQGQNFTLHTHVIDKTNGTILTNETTNCFLHLYNKYGQHVLQEDMDFSSNGIEFELYIGEGNFTNLGLYAYIIQCNATLNRGGFDAGNFEITVSGEPEDPTDTTSGISIILFILLINGLLFALPIFKKKFVTYKSRSTTEVVNFIIRRSILALAIYMMMLTSTIAANISEISNLGLNSEMFFIMEIFGWAGYVALISLVTSTIFKVYSLYTLGKERDRMNEDEE